MPRNASLLCLSSFALSIFGFSGRAAYAQPPPSISVPAEATFSDGLAITGDGAGPYDDGQSGVKCVLFDANLGGSGDFVMNTDANKSSGKLRPSPRTLGFLFNPPAAVSCTPALGGSPPASGYWTANLAVHGLNYPIYNMPLGTQPAVASFIISAGNLRFSSYNPADNPCSAPVNVSYDGTTWTITPASSPVATLYQTVKNQTGPTSFWNMPFQISVTRCATCN
jgi:hypothetical protein